MIEILIRREILKAIEWLGGSPQAAGEPARREQASAL
jgi:hypothetical protein